MRHEPVEFEQRGKLIGILVDVNVELLNAFNGEFLMRKRQDVCFWCKLGGVVDDMLGERRGEQDRLDVLGKKSERFSGEALGGQESTDCFTRVHCSPRPC